MPNSSRWLATVATLITVEVVVYVAFVLIGFYLLSVAAAYVPFFGISDAPADAKINKVGLTLQSLKHILFEEELSSIYTPSPPPPPPTLGR
jgi:hypothetical protein